MELSIFQIDAFSDKVFAGNPAAVVPLEEWFDDKVLLAIAAENNLSETAFFVRGRDSCSLRWFTPAQEIDLCGHATLATAHVLFEQGWLTTGQAVFETASGRLAVERDKDGALIMDFPARPPHAVAEQGDLFAAFGKEPLEVLASRDLFLVYANERAVREIKPDFAALERLDATSVIVTAAGDEVDFVSRFFAPRLGVAEDPVTGSAHCTLTPYWAERLGKNPLRARQISERGGDLVCAMKGERVLISGRAVTYLRGTIEVDVS
jgi:PhzF family phenazine biosynthesis protein